MNCTSASGGGLELGSVVLVWRGQYTLEAAVIEALHPDLGASGFATLRFIGRGGTPLLREGRRTYTGGALPPLDMVPVTALVRANWIAGQAGRASA